MIFVIVLPAKTSSSSTILPQPTGNLANNLDTYNQLKQRLLLGTLVLVAVLVIPTWWFYGSRVAMSFSIGGMGGLVYLRQLARNVDSLGTGSGFVGKARLGIFVALMIIAARWQSLQILPTFLGFLTYKLAVLLLMLQDILKE